MTVKHLIENHGISNTTRDSFINLFTIFYSAEKIGLDPEEIKKSLN